MPPKINEPSLRSTSHQTAALAAAGAGQPVHAASGPSTNVNRKYGRVVQSLADLFGLNKSEKNRERDPEAKYRTPAPRPQPQSARESGATSVAAAAGQPLASSQQRTVRHLPSGAASSATVVQASGSSPATLGSTRLQRVFSFLKPARLNNTRYRPDQPETDIGLAGPMAAGRSQARGALEAPKLAAPHIAAAVTGPSQDPVGASDGTVRISTLTVRGNRNQPMTFNVASSERPLTQAAINLLGARSPLSFSRLYHPEAFHRVLANDLITANRLAQARNQTIRQYLQDDAHLRTRAPQEGRRIRAHLLNVRNRPEHPPAQNVTGNRLNRVLELFNTRNRWSAPWHEDCDSTFVDLINFVNDLHYGKVSQLIPGTPEYEAYQPAAQAPRILPAAQAAQGPRIRREDSQVASAPPVVTMKTAD